LTCLAAFGFVRIMAPIHLDSFLAP
jgi:hypothetical protein